MRISKCSLRRNQANCLYAGIRFSLGLIQTAELLFRCSDRHSVTEEQSKVIIQPSDSERLGDGKQQPKYTRTYQGVQSFMCTELHKDNLNRRYIYEFYTWSKNAQWRDIF